MMMIPRRQSRARAIVRGTRAHNAAFAMLKKAVNFAQKAAPYARRAGAKSTLARKLGKGFRSKTSTIPAITGRVRNNLSAVTQELATLRAKHGVNVGTQMNKKGRYRSSNIAGAYTGTVVPKYKKPKATKYDLYGATHENETAGTNTMQHCNYIGFQSVRPFEFGRVVGMALMRYVMSKFYMVDYSSPLQKLIPATATVAGTTGIPAIFTFEWEQSAGATTNVGSAIFNVSFANNDTLASFGTWFSQNVFNSLVFGGNGASAQRILRRLQITEQVVPNAGGVTVNAYVKSVPLDNLRIEGYSIAKMTVQNSTVSDSNSSSTDVIDANPLRGKLYKFNSLAPSINQLRYIGAGDVVVENYDELATSTTDGVILPSVDPPQAWRAPPKPTMFDRLKGVASVNFEPGQSKEFVLKFYFKGNINYLIQNINQSGGGTFAQANFMSRHGKTLGECLLLALEKRIKGESTVPLIVNYHCDHFAGAVVTGFTRNRMDREFISVERDNDPA